MRRWLLVSVAWLALAATLPAQTEGVETALELAADGKIGEALRRVDAVLAQTPADPAARFAKAYLLTRADRSDEAEPLLLELTRTHPEFPEPFNNLAVLYAERGDFERAVEILKQALGTHSSYRTAYENLTKVYGKLASRAYDRALGQESRDPGPGPALTLLGALDSPAGEVRAEAGRVVVQAPLERRVAPSEPLAAPPPVAPEEVSAPSAPIVERAPATTDFDAGEVASLVQRWAAAWSEQRVDDYLGFYGSDYAPSGMSRREWESQRRVRIARPDFIDVEVESIAVRPAGSGRVQVRFFQSYRSDSYQDRVVKVLDLEREDGGWKIVQETASDI